MTLRSVKKEIDNRMPMIGQYLTYVNGEGMLKHLKENEEILKGFYSEFGIKPE